MHHQRMLSGYRLMWIITLFDLPVTTHSERKNATAFRNKLLDLGFEMVQYSVYTKHCSGKENAETIQKKIKIAVPRYGNVKLLLITDKQFSNIIHLGSEKESQINTRQLALF